MKNPFPGWDEGQIAFELMRSLPGEQASYAAHAINSHGAMAELLVKCEWACVTSAGNQYCPCCRNTKGQGHAPHCELAALIKAEKVAGERMKL